DPRRVSVRAPLPPRPRGPLPAKLNVLLVPVADESIVPVRPLASPMVNRRLVLAGAAVLYCNVPPPKTRSAAEPPEDPWPMLLAVLTLAKVDTLRETASMVLV